MVPSDRDSLISLDYTLGYVATVAKDLEAKVFAVLFQAAQQQNCCYGNQSAVSAHHCRMVDRLITMLLWQCYKYLICA